METKYADVMLDLETTGVYAGCGILSIGAVTFDGNTSFYDKISLDSCHSFGLVDLPDTLTWWDKQDAEAREEAFSGMTNLVEALGGFSDFLQVVRNMTGKEVFLWGNGADFDLPILAAAYRVVGMRQPWETHNGRCYRTLKNLFYEVKADPFDGMKHNALADAKHQARHALKILRHLKEIRNA
jgi:hypothetical protein